MRALDSEYDPRRWHAQEMKRRPRRKATRWVLPIALAFVAVIPIIDLLKPGSNPAPLYMMLMVGSSMSPFTHNSYLMGNGFAALDEFERYALLMAMRRAYFIALALVAAVFAWLALGSHWGWIVPHQPHQWLTLGSAVLIVTAALPVVVAEWTVPMPEVEDQPL